MFSNYWGQNFLHLQHQFWCFRELRVVGTKRRRLLTQPVCLSESLLEEMLLKDVWQDRESKPGRQDRKSIPSRGNSMGKKEE